MPTAVFAAAPVPAHSPTLDRAFRARADLSGTVYGVLLNHRPELLALGDAVNQPPYKSAPRAPVLAVMPRHTHGDV